MKKIFPYLLIFACCITGYVIAKSILIKKTIEREIAYTSTTASEVYMVWGINYLQFPPENYWPPNSFEKGGLVYTKMEETGANSFRTSLRLPFNTILNYWALQKKDNSGKVTEIWDAGGTGKKYFTVNFVQEGLLKPGYFIFLSGFLPLLLYYFKNRRKQVERNNIPGPRKADYIPQLDSIRAIAVLLVIIHHWVPENSVLNILPNGPLGVNIFFTLSGFLITGILLKAKKSIDLQGLKKISVFRNFYIRRTLRIFPIYYLLLLILWQLKDPALTKDGVYYFTYTSNYLFYNQQFFPDRMAHLWSLGVEEQFYLLWPWLIVLASKRILPYLICLFFIVGISSNYIFTSHGWWGQILTPACFDAFAAGGFLSWLTAYRSDIIAKLQPAFKAIIAAVLLLFILDVANISTLPTRTIHAVLAVMIIYYCLFRNTNKLANYILNHKWLIRIGKISYGIYLYHLVIPEFWLYINKKFASIGIDLFFNSAIPEKIRPAWLFIQEFFFLLLISSLSWKLIEKPINKLKDKFAIGPSRVNDLIAGN